MVMPGSSLRLIIGGSASPAWNMAADEALLEHALTSTLRIYQWDRPCMSIGYFSRSKLLPPGVPFVRRASGGGIVRHGSDLTFSAVFPRAHPFARENAGEAYRVIHECLRRALLEHGIRTRLADCCVKDGTGLCFSGYEKYDLLDESIPQKIAGGAQKRSSKGFLHQGSVLLESPAPAPGQFARALAAQFARHFELSVTPSEFTAEEEQFARSLEMQRYSKPEWNEKF